MAPKTVKPTMLNIYQETHRQAAAIADKWGLPTKKYIGKVVQIAIDRLYQQEFPPDTLFDAMTDACKLLFSAPLRTENTHYIIKSLIGTYYIEGKGIGGFSEWTEHVKLFETREEAQAVCDTLNHCHVEEYLI